MQRALLDGSQGSGLSNWMVDSEMKVRKTEGRMQAEGKCAKCAKCQLPIGKATGLHSL